jgi:hypothetical protein
MLGRNVSAIGGGFRTGSGKDAGWAMGRFPGWAETVPLAFSPLFLVFLFLFLFYLKALNF